MPFYVIPRKLITTFENTLKFKFNYKIAARSIAGPLAIIKNKTMRILYLIPIIIVFITSCSNGQGDKLTSEKIWTNYLQTFGNKETVMKIKSLSREVVIKSKQGEIKYILKVKYPDKVYQEIIYPNNQKLISKLNGNKGIHVYPSGIEPFSEKEISDTKLLGLIFPELYYEEFGYEFELKESVSVGDTEYYKIEITNDFETFYFLIGMKDFEVHFTNYSDLKTEILETGITDGVGYIKKSKATMGEDTMISNTILNKYNIEIGDELFEIK